MFIVDENDSEYQKESHDKWKAMVPEITLEQALHCEKLYMEFVNGTKSESIFLAEVNEYLSRKGLIK